MSTSVRLDDQLFHAAEIEAATHKRTPPKQIEYWADIGQAVSRFASSSDLLALMQGVAQINITTPESIPVVPSKVFDQLEQDRKQKVLNQKVSNAPFRYETSQTHPGQLDRIAADGSKQTGHFRNGEFVPAK